MNHSTSMSAREKSIKSSTKYGEDKNLINIIIKKVFCLKKARPIDLTENLCKVTEYLINNLYLILDM